MRISGEGKIAIGLALFFGFGGGAIVAFPSHTEIGWIMMVASVLGGILLAAHHWRWWPFRCDVEEMLPNPIIHNAGEIAPTSRIQIEAHGNTNLLHNTKTGKVRGTIEAILKRNPKS